MNFRHSYLAAAISAVAFFGLCAAEFETKPDDAYFAKFNPVKAPMTSGLALKKGDRLAIIGDSITEQKMYSRMMETYLTVCVPELEVSVRQYGWSGEQAPGFLARMTNDCLQFNPTIATTCYGMNDHGYRTYEPAIGERYRKYTSAILDSFQQAGTRVIQGSPGCVGKVPSWTKSDAYNLEQLNLNLCELRNIGIDLAQTRHIPFADVFWPMLTAQVTANQKYGTNFAVAGKDGVHPGWAGHTIMAYAFLKGLGLDGNLGVIEVNLAKNGAATATPGRTTAPRTSRVMASRPPARTDAADARASASRKCASGDAILGSMNSSCRKGLPTPTQEARSVPLYSLAFCPLRICIHCRMIRRIAFPIAAAMTI